MSLFRSRSKILKEPDPIVEPMKEVPQPMPGAPLPVVLSDDLQLLLCYASQRTVAPMGARIQQVDGDTEFDAVAVATFDLYKIYQFGAPNEEARPSHPLYRYGLGLGTGQVFRVRLSPWIRQLERMNSIHPGHDPQRYERLTHYVFTFEDRTFECVAEGVSFEQRSGSLRSVAGDQLERLFS
jgi:hypothetical protein